MRVLVAASFVLLFACTRRPDTYIVPLAEMEAAIEVGPDSRIFSEHNTLRLIADRDPCLVLSPRATRITLDIYSGDMDPGNPEYANRECYGPAFSWDSVPVTSGPSTFTLTDGTATWTLVMWQPFEYRQFELVAQSPIRAGDTVTYRLATRGTFDNARVVVTVGTSTELLDLQEGNGVTRSGNELSFVLPANAPATTARVEISADHHIRIDRCDGPYACEGSDRVSDRIDLEIVP